MRTMKYVTLAALAAAGLALASCGGGSKKPATAMGGEEQMMTPDDWYNNAKAAEKAAMTARTTAKTQLDAAKKADPADIYNTGGDSGVVATNAKIITDAKAAVEKALAEAKAEKMKAEEAKKELDAASSDTPGLAAQKEVAASAIEKVEAEIKLIEGYLRTINGYAGRVDTEAKIKARADETPAGDADASGNQGTYSGARGVLYMLQPFSESDGAPKVGATTSRREDDTDDDLIGVVPTKVVLPATSDPDQTDNTGRSRAYLKYDLRGLPEDVMTWEQIAGAGNLIKKAFGTDNMDVDVLPLAGMPLSVLTGSDGTALTALPAFPNNKADTQYYKGVKGTLHCQGSCTVDEGKLTGNLFFQWLGEESGDQTRYYRMKATDAHYTRYGAYARYGYWLYETGEDVGIRLFAHAPAGYGGDVSETAGLAKTATYKGEAFGLSVLKTYTAGTHTGQKSGQFTADVTLNATFVVGAVKSKLKGKIDNFKGSAVGSDWSVTLQEGTAEYEDLIDVEGVAQGSAAPGGDMPQAGEWQGEGYHHSGPGRPDGMIGTFNAHFGTGHAAGGYAARIDTE